jgi:hypothetical protein
MAFGARLLISIVAGFLLMWPLGALFGRMNWPVFHLWGLAHGSFVLAWPLLSALCFVFLALFVRPARPQKRTNAVD